MVSRYAYTDHVMIAGSGDTWRQVDSFALNFREIALRARSDIWSILIRIRWRTQDFNTERVLDRQFSWFAQGGSRSILRQTAWLAQDRGMLVFWSLCVDELFPCSENTKIITIIPEQTNIIEHYIVEYW